MSTLAIPLDFGRRQCDRLLVLKLSGLVERDVVRWMSFLVWQDYATAREDRREVPADSSARRRHEATTILEQFIGWKGEPGGFVEPAIDSGFFMLTPVSDQLSHLVLTDFFPANASAIRVTHAQAGGVGKSMNKIVERAKMAASDQLKLFERDGSLTGMDPNRARACLLLIHQICLSLRRQPPVDDTWKNTLIPLAGEILESVDARERDAVMRWFIANRQDQRIPPRLDFILQQFKSFIPEAVSAFGR